MPNKAILPPLPAGLPRSDLSGSNMRPAHSQGSAAQVLAARRHCRQAAPGIRPFPRSGKTWQYASTSQITETGLVPHRPPRRERSVRFQLPALQSAAHAASAMAALTAAVATGEVSPGEAAELSKLVEAYVKALEAGEFDQRLRAVEARNATISSKCQRSPRRGQRRRSRHAIVGPN